MSSAADRLILAAFPAEYVTAEQRERLEAEFEVLVSERLSDAIDAALAVIKETSTIENR